MKPYKLTNGTLVFPPSGVGKSTTLNPLAFEASPEHVIAYLGMTAGVSLSPEQEEAAVGIYLALPAKATIRDFLSACDHEASKQLGIPVERIEALAPLLMALEEVAKPGRYNGLFDDGNVADCQVNG